MTSAAPASVRVTLTQTAANTGITQQYTLANTGAAPLDLSFVTFHDVDLDPNTFLNNIAAAVPGALSVSEGGRTVYFSASQVGYAGYLVGHVPGSGITSGLDAVGYNNFGIPGGSLNQFRDVTGGNIGADWDVNADLMSDNPTDVGYLFQHNLNIASGGSATVIIQHAAIPEPSAAVLGLLALGLPARRRRLAHN
jgi:MYXO-CTERM domain-containing protein